MRFIFFQVIFSDESIFSLQAVKHHVRRRSGQRLNPQCMVPTVKHSESVMVWGCFSFHAPGRLHVIPKGTTVNAAVYKGILEKRLMPSARDMYPDGNYIFQDDGAPCHRAKTVKAYLSENNIHTINDWPGQSPDLNPIENLWAIMKFHVRRSMPKNRTELIEAVLRSWHHAVSKLTLEKLVESMPRRLKSVIASRGFPTKY